jgi:hypothetical protein
MTDPYLLLTPVLALAVLALARFVGCHLLFDLEPVPDYEPPVEPVEVPFVKAFALGTSRTDATSWVGMVIKVGAKPLSVTQLGRIMLTASTGEHQVKLVQPAGTGGVDVMNGKVTIPPSAAIQPSPDNPGFAYATVPGPVTLLQDTEYYLVSYESAAGGDVFHSRDTTVTTTDIAHPTAVAEVSSGVYSDDTDPDNPLPMNAYTRAGGPGNTYGPVNFIYKEEA